MTKKSHENTSKPFKIAQVSDDEIKQKIIEMFPRGFNEMNVELINNDLWVDFIPDDVYAQCPCGCGKKWKHLIKQVRDMEDNQSTRGDGEKLLAQHEAAFRQRIQKILGDLTVQ